MDGVGGSFPHSLLSTSKLNEGQAWAAWAWVRLRSKGIMTARPLWFNISTRARDAAEVLPNSVYALR